MSMVEGGEQIPQTDPTDTDGQKDFQNTTNDRTESKTTKPDKGATSSACCQTSAEFSNVRQSNRPKEELGKPCQDKTAKASSEPAEAETTPGEFGKELEEQPVTAEASSAS